jgi:DNA primase
MPRIDFRAARAQLRLADVLTLCDFTPTSRHGLQWRGPCPVHRSRRPASRSFAAHVGKNVWHCFTCRAGGNALDLWIALTSQPVYAAVLDLCARLGQDVPLLQPCRAPERRERGYPRRE